jgi:hypothetical protein
MEFGVSCSPSQMRKLKSGGAVTLKQSNFVDGSPNRIMVMPNTSRRIMTAMKKGKGVRIALKPEEDVVAMTEGGAVSMKGMTGRAMAMKGAGAGKRVRNALKKTGSVVKKGFETPAGRAIASKLIDIGTQEVLPAALGAASMALGDPTGMSGEMVGEMAGRAINRAAAKKGYGAGKKVKKVVKKAVKKAAPILKEIGKIALREGTAAAGQALTEYTGDPAAGAAFERIVNAGGDRFIETGSAKSGLRASAGSAKNMAGEYLDDYMMERQGMGLGGLPRRTRNGLRMGQGMAHLTPAYSVAMRSSTIGAGFKVADDRMVTPATAPSSVIQTGSPFQRINSPAMSPYIPSSPQLAGQRMGRSGGSIYPAGRSGGSMYPAG